MTRLAAASGSSYYVSSHLRLMQKTTFYPRAHPMKASKSVCRMLVAVVLSVGITACHRAAHVQAVVDKAENIEKGMPVFVDSIQAGTVASVSDEGGERVARLEISEKVAKERMRVGVVRLVSAGRIQLNTEAVKANAELLPDGARIPQSTQIGYLIRKYSDSSTLLAVGGGLAALLLSWMLFRSIVGTIGLVVTMALSGIATQALYPYGVPYMERALDRLGPPPDTRAVVAPAPDVTGRTTSALQPSAKSGLIDSMAGAVGGAALRGAVSTADSIGHAARERITRVVSGKPSPVVLTWASMFVVCFVCFNAVMGRATRSWRS